MQNKFFIRAICSALALATIIISAKLTYDFMYEIGGQIGAPYALAAIGLIIDVSKSVAPLIVILLYKQRMFLGTMFAGALAIILSLISFAASVSTIESGVNASKKESAQYVQYTQQINLLETELNDFRELAQSQKSADQITKAEKTLLKVSELSEKISVVRQKQNSITAEGGVVAEHGELIAYITSGSLEAISVLMTIALYAISKSDSVARTTTVSEVVAEDKKTKSKKAISPFHAKQTTNTPPKPPLTEKKDALLMTKDAPIKNEEDIIAFEGKEAEITEAIKNGDIRPTQTLISEHFNVSKEYAKDLCKKLYDEGVLKPFKRGYVLASV